MSSKSMMAVALLVPIGGLGACEHIEHMMNPHGDPKLAAQAAVPFERAQSIALATRSGKIKEWELEKEAGGSGLRYSFDIVSNGVLYEVGVDARDGAVLENGLEAEGEEDDEDGEN
ncbi:MAG: PepSY domain-containing protein [Hyphomonadaceae bacterium]|nr:PepSY domain-containing protein [Hyphomonadaceae bacterium]